jgi:hypothetical protein
MDIHTYRCSSCGSSDCRDPYHRVYTQQLNQLTQLLAQPEADPHEIWMRMFAIYALDKRFHVMQENVS